MIISKKLGSIITQRIINNQNCPIGEITKSWKVPLLRSPIAPLASPRWNAFPQSGSAGETLRRRWFFGDGTDGTGHISRDHRYPDIHRKRFIEGCLPYARSMQGVCKVYVREYPPKKYVDCVCQWEFQNPKLEVPTIYKDYIRTIKGNIPTKYSHWS
jgi:hypothetical protein